MQNHHQTGTADRADQTTVVPWDWFERQAALAFTLAGVLLLASAGVPLALKAVTGWAWVSGLIFVGLGVLSAAFGIFGLYPRLNSADPVLPTVGILGGVVAGGAALGLIALAGIALVGEGALGMDFGKPIGIFAVLSLSMVGGFALGSLSAGTAGLRSSTVSRATSLLLLIGGASLSVPVGNEVLHRGFGLETGIPSWLFLPALGLISVVSLAIGSALRAES